MAHAEDKHPEPKHEEPKPSRKVEVESRDHSYLKWPLTILSGALAFVIVWSVLYGTLSNDDASSSPPTKTAEAVKDHKSIWDSILIKPDQALPPFDKSGGKSGAAPNIFAKQGQSPGAAPSPFSQGNSGPYTNAACKGGKRSSTLVPGTQPYPVDRFNACRIPYYVPPGALIEAMDEHGEWYRLQPGSTREITAVRAVNSSVTFSYTRCSKESPDGMLNWDCSSLTQYASQ
ncbi:MAG TPA: hypothetical protein VIY48_18315 [Candidatus Paceibacterota bacterium]